MSDKESASTDPVELSDELRKEACDREFERYYKERDEWVKAQLDGARSYDALLVTISTLALGASLAKPPTTSGGFSVFILILGWVAFGACLIASLLHRYFTYYTHKKWVDIVDAEFSTWKVKAFERANAKYDSIPYIKRVESLTIYAGVAVGIGILCSLIFMVETVIATHMSSTTQPATTAPAFAPVITITNTATTNGQPSTQPSKP